MIITAGSKVKDGEGNLYTLNDILGSGGFGNVFKAYRDDSGEVFAVKTLLSTFESQDSVLAFEKEIQQAAIVSSDHVIKYIFVHDGQKYAEYPPYIIMEYADGGALTNLIAQQKENGEPFNNSFLINTFVQLAEGMNEINKILVHRDIKPDNILLSRGIMKISDFGLSKLSGENTRTLTFKGYGTAKYIAPEAWNNDKNTIQMDIYSMGIVFYELATLHYPYNLNDSSDIMTIRNAHLMEAVMNPNKFNSNLPGNIISVILRMIEKPTQRRFSDWESIVSALKVKAPVEDVMGNVVQNAIRNRNEAEIALQEKMSAKLKLEQEKDDFCKLIRSQYETFVFEPLQEFVTMFNEQYAGTSSLRLFSDNSDLNSIKFSYRLILPSNTIKIVTEIILKENYTRQIRPDFPGESHRTVNYIPQCDNRDILSWSQVSDNQERGFNILLLKREGELYGDWYTLVNTNSGLSRSQRTEPFGFRLNELEKEIHYIRAMHIYNSELRPFVPTDIPNFIAECI